MDPKTVLVICVFLVAAGSTVKNLLSLAGATKTKVEGGAGTQAVYLTATVASLIGWGIFLVLLVMSGDTIVNAISCLF